MFSRAEPTSRNDGAANGLVRVDSVGITQPVIYFPDSYGTKPFVEQRAVNRRGRPSNPVDDRDWGSSPYSTMDLRQPPYSTGHNGSSGYGGHSEYSKNDSWNRPSGNTIRNDGFDDYHRRIDRAMEVMNTSGGVG